MAKNIIITIFSIFFVILLFLFFRLLCFHSWFSRITLSYEVVPLDVINLFVTTIVTIILAWYITKKLSAIRYEKEFVIADLKNIEEQINYFEKITGDINSIGLQPVLDILSKLHTNIDRFNKTAEILQISCKESSKLETYYMLLYKKATNVDGLQLNLDNASRNEIQTVCNNFVITTRKIICTINKQ